MISTTRALLPPEDSPAVSESRHRWHSGGTTRGHNGCSKFEQLAVDLHLAAADELPSALEPYVTVLRSDLKR